MKELTQEIKDKIKLLAINKMTDGIATLVPDPIVLKSLIKMYEDMYKNNQLEVE